MSNYTLGCINLVSKVIWIELKWNMLTTANMCIPRASLNSSCASMIFILRIHAIGVPEGVTLLEFEGANQGGAWGVGNRRNSRRGGVARVPWPPSFLFPEGKPRSILSLPCFYKYLEYLLFVDDALSIEIGWNQLLHYISILIQISLESYLSLGTG